MIAALFAAPGWLLLAQAVAPALPPAEEASRAAGIDADRLTACEALAKQAPDQAYEEGRAWTAESPVPEAKYCLAAAAYALGRPLLAAQQFEAVALAFAGHDKREQAQAQSDAGNAWLLAGDAARALAAFDKAVAFQPDSPDVYVDRARAYAYLRNWRRAEEDINAALALREPDTLLLRLRAETRLQQGALDLALKDITEALSLSPGEDETVEALLVRGRIVQAQQARAGAASAENE